MGAVLGGVNGVTRGMALDVALGGIVLGVELGVVMCAGVVLKGLTVDLNILVKEGNM